MDVWDSFVRVIYDPEGLALVLVDFGDAMWEPVRIDGRQLVEEQSFVRAPGARAIPRGNESHTLTWEKCREQPAMDDAFAARLGGMISLPRGGADVLLALADGRQWRLAHCAVRSWPGGQEERLTRDGVEIQGGRLTIDAGSYTPGLTWGEIAYEWEHLG